MKRDYCLRCETTTETFYGHQGEECGRCAQPRNDPKVICGACPKEFKVSKQHAHLSGKFYCSKACYGTLFLICQECGERNMGAKDNLRRHNEQLCDACYDRKHGLTSVTISGGIIRY